MFPARGDAAPKRRVVVTRAGAVSPLGDQPAAPPSPLEFANCVLNGAAGEAAIWHRLRGVNSTIAAGEASGLLALAQAAELVRAGRAAAVLAGGAEELCFESFLGLYRAGRLCGSRP